MPPITPTATIDSRAIGENPQDIKSSTASESWVKEQIATAKKEVRDDADKAIREQVQTDKASLITVFGIFASVISFLTIEFQFLKTICSMEKILGFTLILFTLLFGFNVALDYLVKSRLDNKTPKPNLFFSILVIILFIVGILFTFMGNEQSCKDNEVYLRYSDQFETKFYDKEKEINQQLIGQNAKIEKIESLVNLLNKTK